MDLWMNRASRGLLSLLRYLLRLRETELSFGEGDLNRGERDLSMGGGDLSRGERDLSLGEGDLSLGCIEPGTRALISLRLGLE